MRNQFNTYIASINVDLSKESLVLRHFIERFVGARNLCSYRFTVSKYDRDNTATREDYANKDPTGDAIIKCK